jgi:hypothetical protein
VVEAVEVTSIMSLVAVGSGVNNHILTAQGSPHLTPPASTRAMKIPLTGDGQTRMTQIQADKRAPAKLFNESFAGRLPLVPGQDGRVHLTAELGCSLLCHAAIFIM